MRFSWSRWVGIIVKEFIQLKRDRLTFGMIIGIPVLQLILFGYAINSDPKRLPTAVLAADASLYSRSMVSAMQTSGYFRIDHYPGNEKELESAIGELKGDAELRWRKSQAGLEDVFIHLMEQVEDNAQ